MHVIHMHNDNGMKEDSHFVVKQFFEVPPKMAFLRQLQTEIPKVARTLRNQVFFPISQADF